MYILIKFRLLHLWKVVATGVLANVFNLEAGCGTVTIFLALPFAYPDITIGHAVFRAAQRRAIVHTHWTAGEIQYCVSAISLAFHIIRTARFG